MPIENMNEIESSLGLAEGTLQEAIASEDATKIEIPAGKFYNEENFEIFAKEDYIKRTDNLKEENKAAGVEIAVKSARNEHELDFEGKTIPNLLAAYKDKILKDAQIEPDAKNAESEKTISGLRKNLEELQSKLDATIEESRHKDARRSIKSEILSHIPDNLTISQEDAANLFELRYKVSKEDGKFVTTQNGEVMKDQTTFDALPLKDIVESFVGAYAKKVEGGSGEGDTTNPGKGGSLEAFNKEMEGRDGYNIGGEKYMIEMNRRVADGTLKI